MKNDYFHRVAKLTPTKMWINNVTSTEAELAIAAGARGCTQNPSYTWKMLNHPEEKTYAKKVYNIMHDRGYELGFIGGGVRGLQHFTEMVGGDVCITMNWKGHADKLIELGQSVVSRLFNPVQDKVLDTLLEKVPGFRQAYMENGLSIDEYEDYGPVVFFRNSFVSAWEKCN